MKSVEKIGYIIKKAYLCATKAIPFVSYWLRSLAV